MKLPRFNSQSQDATRKPEPAAKPYTCIKCAAKVYVKPEHHAYVCHLYQEQRKGAKA